MSRVEDTQGARYGHTILRLTVRIRNFEFIAFRPLARGEGVSFAMFAERPLSTLVLRGSKDRSGS
jgi:hypothetical protein